MVFTRHCNTEYFHRIANGRKRTNAIFYLKNEDEVIKGDDKLSQHSTYYYKKLFGPAEGNLFHLNATVWSQEEKMTEGGNDWISRPFDEEEVKKVVFDMETNKVPGPDCIPFEFYKKNAGI